MLFFISFHFIIHNKCRCFDPHQCCITSPKEVSNYFYSIIYGVQIDVVPQCSWLSLEILILATRVRIPVGPDLFMKNLFTNCITFIHFFYIRKSHNHVHNRIQRNTCVSATVSSSYSLQPVNGQLCDFTNKALKKEIMSLLVKYAKT